MNEIYQNLEHIIKNYSIGIDIDDTMTNIKDKLTNSAIQYAKSLNKEENKSHLYKEKLMKLVSFYQL